MSLSKLPFAAITDDIVNVVYKELGLDAEKYEYSFMLVKYWLECENHLPNNVDEVLIKNFILGSKGNVERTKEKLEKYIIAKTNVTHLLSNRPIKDEEFANYPSHRWTYISPKHTKKGNRIIILRVPEKDPTHFNYLYVAKYFCLAIDVLLYHDTCAGYHFIYDVAAFTPQILSKINLTLLKQVSELLYNTFPARIKSIQLVNDSIAIHTVMSIGKMFMSQKLKDRISGVKLEDLPKLYPKECLPIEYGGTDGKIDDKSDELLKILKNSKEWCLKSEEPKLIGPIPEDKKKLFSFDDFSMDGSFRKINVD